MSLKFNPLTGKLDLIGLTTSIADARYLKLDASNSMSSTTLITNLNADLLDGQHGSYYATAAGYLKLDQTTPQTILNGAPIFNAGLVSNGNVIFNEGGDPLVDFRVETDTSPNFFLIDSSDNKLIIGENGVNTSILKNGNTAGDEFFVGTTGAFRVQRSGSNSEAFRVQVSGDTNGRWLGTSDGKLKWGTGAATQDVWLTRSTTSTLFISTDGTTPATLVVGTVIGGTGTISDLTLQTTSGVGTTGADMHFLVGNNGATEAMTILNNGNVGIGTTSPGAKLQINAATTTTDGLILKTTDDNTTKKPFQVQKSDGGVTSFFTAEGGLRVGVYGGYAAANGGIQITNAEADADATIRGGIYRDSVNMYYGTVSNSKLFLIANNLIRLTIDPATSNVGIGNNFTTPGAMLHVKGGASAITSIFQANATTPGNLTEWQNSSGGVLASVNQNGQITNTITVPDNVTYWGINTTVNATGKSYADGFVTNILAAQTQYVTGYNALVDNVSTSGTMNTLTGIQMNPRQRSSYAIGTMIGGDFLLSNIGSGNVSLAYGMRVIYAGNVTYGTGITGTYYGYYHSITDGQDAKINNLYSFYSDYGTQFLSSGATTRITQIIKAVASQSVDQTQWQSSTGGVLASISATGGLTVSNDSLTTAYFQNNETTGANRSTLYALSFFNSVNNSQALGVAPVSLSNNTQLAGTSNVTNVKGQNAIAIIGSQATLTNWYPSYIDTPSITAGGTLVNSWGLYIANQNVATTLNYAIYTNAGLVRFGDRTLLAASTTAGASLNIPTGTAPTSPVEGDLWNDSTQKTIKHFTNGIAKSIVGTLFTQTADQTVANTVTETTLFGTGVGTVTLPANYFVAGKTIRIRLFGYFSTTGNPNIQFKLKYGSTVLLDSGAFSAGTGITNHLFHAEVRITCRTTGATGTVYSQGMGHLFAAHGTSGAFDMESNAAVTINTTTSNALDFTAQWGTADAGNTITITNVGVETLN